MRSTRRPERRNRKIGTKAAGFKKSNKMRVPESRFDRDGSARRFSERMGPHQTVGYEWPGGSLTFLYETPRPGCTYGCSPKDVAQVLANVPAPDLEGLKIVAFRQPTRKQENLEPVWGRLFCHADFEEYEGPAIVIEAVDLSRPLRWSRKMSLEDQYRLAQLREDGHRIEEDRRGYTIHFTESSVRQRILYFTLLHELGHWVDWVTKVERPPNGDVDRYLARQASEHEAFANAYADRLAESLRREGVIPFPPLEPNAAVDGSSPQTVTSDHKVAPRNPPAIGWKAFLQRPFSQVVSFLLQAISALRGKADAP